MHRFAMMILVLAILSPAAFAGSTTVPFNYNQGGFDFGPDTTTLVDDGDNSYLNFTNVDDDNFNVRGWFTFWNEIDQPWVGDYTVTGDAQITIDVDVDFYDFLSWGDWVAVEEYRELVIELVDFDNPAEGYPYTSVWFNAGPLPARDAGWKSYTIDITDVHATELPEGWGGYGAEHPETYEPMLPDHRTWSDVLAGVDEIRFTTLVPGYFYSLDFKHGINVDNITIETVESGCNGLQATIYVEDGVVVGGPYDGKAYTGLIAGSPEADVIVGTNEGDMIIARQGDDTICGRGGRDLIKGDWGHDVIFGGSGDDRILGGLGDDHLDGGSGTNWLIDDEGNNTCENGGSGSQCVENGTSRPGSGRVERGERVERGSSRLSEDDGLNQSLFNN